MIATAVVGFAHADGVVREVDVAVVAWRGGSAERCAEDTAQLTEDWKALAEHSGAGTGRAAYTWAWWRQRADGACERRTTRGCAPSPPSRARQPAPPSPWRTGAATGATNNPLVRVHRCWDEPRYLSSLELWTQDTQPALCPDAPQIKVAHAAALRAQSPTCAVS